MNSATKHQGAYGPVLSSDWISLFKSKSRRRIHSFPGLAPGFALIQSRYDTLNRDAVDFHDFVPGGMAPQQLHTVPRAAKMFCQKPDECFIGRGIYGGGGHLYFKFVAGGTDNCIGGSPGLHFER